MTQVTEREIRRTPGLGVENRWAMEALINVTSLAKAEKLEDYPDRFKDCPPLSVKEAKRFEKLISEQRVRIKILPFSSHATIDYSSASRKGQTHFTIKMRPDVAAAIRGVVGFEPIVVRSQNKNLVETIKDIVKEK